MSVGINIVNNDLAKLMADKFGKFPCMQIFSHDTQSSKPVWLPNDIKLLRLYAKRIYSHSSFKIVIGKPYSNILFAEHYEYLAKLRIDGFIVHLPSNMPAEDCVEYITKMFKHASKLIGQNSDFLTTVYFEHVPSEIYSKAANMAKFAKLLADSKPILPVGICIDTCHVYASGVKITSAEDVQLYFEQLRYVNMPILIHLNDSIGEFGSFVDHHGNLGSKIWKDDKSGLAALVAMKHDKIIELKDCLPSLEYLIEEINL